MHILFPVTYDCNLSCKSCAAKKNTPIDIKRALQNIKNAKKKFSRLKWVYITGGEPFLISNLPQICQELKDVDFKIGVTTNGTIFRPEIADYVDRLGASIDGDREYNDSYRGPGTFDKAMDLLKSVKDKCETVVMSVAFKDNQESLLKLKPIVEDLDPTYWQIQRDYFNPDLRIDDRLLQYT